MRCANVDEEIRNHSGIVFGIFFKEKKGIQIAPEQHEQRQTLHFIPFQFDEVVFVRSVHARGKWKHIVFLSRSTGS